MRKIAALMLVVFVGQTANAQTTFHGNNARTGVYQSAGPKVLKGIKWQFKTQGAIISSPAIADGIAYFGNLNGSLYAVDIKTGSVVWEFQTEASRKDVLQFLNPDRTRKNEFSTNGFGDFEDMYVYWYKNFSLGAIVSSPVVDRGEVYFGSTDGNLYALN